MRKSLGVACAAGAILLAAVMGPACGLPVVGEGATGRDDAGANQMPDTVDRDPPPRPTDAGAPIDAGPVDPCDASVCVTGLSAGPAHACAAIRGAPPRCWGDGASGQLGAAAPGGGVELRPSSTPLVVEMGPATSVASGGLVDAPSSFGCAVGADAGVWCWGADTHGQQGPSANGGAEPLLPHLVSGAEPAREIAAGGAHVCALREGGGVVCWGHGVFGQLGRAYDPATNRALGPVPLPRRALQISAGENHSCAVLDDGGIHCWGWNAWGQLARAELGASIIEPGPVSPLGPAAAVSAGYGHTCARLADGTVACWGLDGLGQLGRGAITSASAAPAPPLLPPDQEALDVCAGYQHSCAVLEGGYVYCWGANDKGQAGVGLYVNGVFAPAFVASPVPVEGVRGAVRVACGARHSCAALANGAVMCWGANEAGQLGRGGGAQDDLPHFEAESVAF